MRNRIPVHVALIVAAVLHASPASADVPPAATQPTTRPTPDRDPWVFRCVLDDNPRMLVISLGDHWWMAFNTVDCSISKIWNGEIELTGAVYDTQHGPQPKAKGTFFLGQPLSWTAGPYDQRSPAVWHGYEIRNDEVTLNWTQGAVRFALSPHLVSNRIEVQIRTHSQDKSLTVTASVGLTNGMWVRVQPLSGLKIESAAGGMVLMPAEGETLVTIDIREDVMKSKSTEETSK